MDDIDLIKLIKRNYCSDCLVELKNKHGGLIQKIYSKYAGLLEKKGYSQLEFNDDILFLIYNSVKSFDLRRRTKIKFSSWLAFQIRFFCLHKLNKENKILLTHTEDSELDFAINNNKDLHYHHSSNYHDDYKYVYEILEQLQDKRIITIFNLRFFSKDKVMTWKEIANYVDLTPQGALNLFKKGCKFLKTKLRSNVSSDIL